MIYVFIDDGTLEIIENINVARTNYEGIDVENDVYSFFNEKGIYLKPIFTTPNIIKKHLFGLFTSIQSGIYELTEAPNECKESFEKKLDKNPILSKNKWFKSLEEIKNQKNT